MKPLRLSWDDVRLTAVVAVAVVALLCGAIYIGTVLRHPASSGKVNVTLIIDVPDKGYPVPVSPGRSVNNQSVDVCGLLSGMPVATNSDAYGPLWLAPDMEYGNTACDFTDATGDWHVRVSVRPSSVKQFTKMWHRDSRWAAFFSDSFSSLRYAALPSPNILSAYRYSSYYNARKILVMLVVGGYGKYYAVRMSTPYARPSLDEAMAAMIVARNIGYQTTP